MSGTVYLVGAGPGDPGLLTCKGREILARADTVVYDALVGPAILAMIPPSARCIDAGKRAGRHAMSQAALHAVLCAEARAGRTVVRLQGGDPFLFGRGGEELEALRAQDVSVEIVPGVTAALAAPAYGGIPATHRALASSVHIFTAHRGQDAPLALNFPLLARLEGTLVFLMGVSALPALCRGLLEAGMDPETPAAAVEQGTRAEQRRISATLSTLPAAARDLAAPAVIAVGRVCGLHLDWTASLPLFGRRIFVTRPRVRTAALSARLRALGAEVVEYPTVSLRPLDADLSALDGCQWLALTSPSGVHIFFDILRAQGRDLRTLAGLRVAALGPGTAAALAEHGIFADLVPAQHSAAGLGAALAAALAPGERVCIARALAGSPALTAALDPAQYRETAIYETVLTHPPLPYLPPLLEAGAWAVFTSASTVRGFAAAAGAAACRTTALCIGAQTAAEAEKSGMRTYISKESSVDSLVELALECGKEEAI